MAHVEKYSRQAVTGLSAHIERKTKLHSNKDIDTEKSHLNYSLLSDGSSTLLRLKKRLDEVYVLNRKDVKVVCSWVVTLPESFKGASANETKEFFSQTHEFLKNRYNGLKNVVASEIHMDETTPHLHFAFIPVVFDKKRGREKVSAKEVLTRVELKSFHHDLDQHLKKTIPEIYQKGILNGKTLGLDSVEQIKLHDLVIANAKKEVVGVEQSLISLEAQYKAKKEFIAAADKISDISMMYPDYAKGKTQRFTKKQTVTVPKEEWELRHISANEKGILKKATETFERELNQFKSGEIYQDYQKVREENYELLQELQATKKDLRSLKNDSLNYRILENIFNQTKTHIKEHFSVLKKAAKSVDKINPHFSAFAQVFLSATLEDKNLAEIIKLSTQGWNHGYEETVQKYNLCRTPEELEIKNQKEQSRSQDYEMSL